MVTRFACPRSPYAILRPLRRLLGIFRACYWLTFVIAACTSLACCIYLWHPETYLLVGLLGGVVGVIIVIGPFGNLSEYRTTIAAKTAILERPGRTELRLFDLCAVTRTANVFQEEADAQIKGSDLLPWLHGSNPFLVLPSVPSFRSGSWPYDHPP